MSGRRLLSTTEGTRPEAFGPSEWGLFGFAGLTWGASFLFIAEGLDGFAPGAVTFLRIAFGWLTLAVLPRSREPVDRHDLPRLLVLGVVWMGFPLSMFPLAEERVSSSLTGMLNGATPLFVAAVASLLLGRLPGVNQRLGLVVGLAGIVLIGLPTADEGASSLLGVGLILLALSSYGIALNLAVPLQQRYGGLPVLWRTQSVALVLTAPFGVYGLGDSRPDGSALLACVALGAGGTALAYVAAATLAGRVGSTRASMTTYLIPPVSIVLGVLVRDEDVAALSLVGAAVVLLGAWLASRADGPTSAT